MQTNQKTGISNYKLPVVDGGGILVVGGGRELGVGGGGGVLGVGGG